MDDLSRNGFLRIGRRNLAATLELVGRLLESYFFSLWRISFLPERFFLKDFPISIIQKEKEDKSKNYLCRAEFKMKFVICLFLVVMEKKGRKNNIHQRYGLAHQNKWGFPKDANCAGKRLKQKSPKTLK